MRFLISIVLYWSAASTAWSAPLSAAVQEVRQVMGTLATVQVWAPDDSTARAAIDTAFGVFDTVDSLMSTWNGNSRLSRLNAAPAETWVTMGPDVCRVLKAAIAVSDMTDGAFDPTVLPLVRLWGFRSGMPAVPPPSAIAAGLDLVAVGALEVNGDRARLCRSGMAIDLGGIAKGYALDQAAAAMKRAGARGGVLDLGGNLLAFGRGPPPQVGVVDPTRPHTLALTVPLSDGAIATSGQSERFVTVDGQAYGHVLDPRTGWPVVSGFSASVLAPEALWADALATAVLVLGAGPGLRLLENLPGIEGVIVGPDGIQLTSGLAADRSAD